MKQSIICAMLCYCIAAKAQPGDAYMQSVMTAGNLPGVEAVIIKDGNWMYSHSWGKADIPDNKAITQQTVFMLASISKTVIATALMQLWERGAFQLDDNINPYLPFEVRNPGFPGDSITFRMLVTHTSSLQDNYDVLDSSYVNGDSPVSLDTFLRNYLVPGGVYYDAVRNFYAYRPGATYNYSNIGATLAAYLVQRITGDDYSHYCDTAIFAKICMGNTCYKLAGFPDTSIIARPYSWDGAAFDDDGLYGYPDYPDGQLRTNIASLARFMTMYLQYGVYNGVRVLDSATVAMMMSQQAPGVQGQGIIFYQRVYAGTDTLWGHNGGDAGVSTAMYFSFKTHTGVIVLTNGDYSPGDNMEFLADTLYKYGVTLTPRLTDTFPSCYYPESTESPAAALKTPVLFPNPVDHELYIDLGGTQFSPASHAWITSIAGARQEMPTTVSGSILSINTSSLTPGVYVLTLTDGDRCREFHASFEKTLF